MSSNITWQPVPPAALTFVPELEDQLIWEAKSSKPVIWQAILEKPLEFTVNQYGGGGGGEYDWYYGPFDITPLAYLPVILPTVNKVVSRNIVVKEVSFVTKENSANGLTAYIACPGVTNE